MNPCRPTDKDIEDMGDYLKSLVLPYTPVTTKCLFIGRHCSSTHIIDVIPIYPLRAPDTHHDLELVMWSRGLPHYSDGYVDLESSRVLLSFKLLGDVERHKADYVVIHFDQFDSDMHVASQTQNKAMLSIITVDHALWHGDLFVVKLDPLSGKVVDVLPTNIEDIAFLMTDAILSTRLI